MQFNSRKLMHTTETQSSKLFRSLYFYGYPLMIVSGLFLRLYIGELSMHQVQSTAGTFFIPCIFHWLTDFDCPGCGITRSLTAMFLWSPLWSFYFHPLGPVFAILALFYWFSLVFVRVERWFVRCAQLFNAHSVSLLVIILAWGIFRNF